MSAEDGMLYHTVVEKLDDVLHCGKTNCLVILLSGAAGIIGLLAFIVCHFNQSRRGSKKKSQAAKASPSAAKKPSKPEKKKEEDVSAKKRTVKEAKPASPVQKKKENKVVEPVVVAPKTTQAPAPTKKNASKAAAADQHGEKSEDWVTVTNKKDRKSQPPRGKENEESPNNKASTKTSGVTSPSKSGDRPLVEKVQPSEPKVVTTVASPDKEKKSSTKMTATNNVALAHDAPPAVVPTSKESVSKKEAGKLPTSSKPTAVKTPTPSSSSIPAVAKPATGGNSAASTKKAVAAAPSAATPAPVAEGVDPEWTEIKGGSKKRSRAKKE